MNIISNCSESTNRSIGNEGLLLAPKGFLKKEWVIAILAVVLMFGVLSNVFSTEVQAAELTAAEQKITVYLDRFILSFDVEPRVLNTATGGHTVVPFRKLAESLGVKVTWDQATQTIRAEGYDKQVLLTIDQPTAQVNGSSYSLGAAPMVDQGHTLIPLRFFSEVFGADVKWNQMQKTIHITSPKRDLYTFAFYGLGSFAQREYISYFDGMAYTWSRINQQGEWTISNANSNEYFWPAPHPDASPEDLIASGQQVGGEAFLMVAAFESRGEVSALLLDTSKRELAMEQMLHKVQEKNMEGILIDFEGISNKEEHQELKQSFTTFIQELTTRAKQQGVKVGIALPPVNNFYNGYEYKKLGELADFIFLMAYDYNPRGEGLSHQLPEPMLLVNQGIEQTLEHIPAHKMILGINIIYETELSMVDKIGLAKRHDLKGIGLWILRGMNDAYFEQLRESVL